MPKPNWYNCPYRVNEDDDQVKITLEIFPPEIVYYINKTTEEVTFTKDTTGVFGAGCNEFLINSSMS